MGPRGIYRVKTPQTGAEYAHVDYGIPSMAGEIPRATYEEEGYAPPFNKLPTKEMYEQWKERNA
jgi:hypothetical protein